MLSYCKNLKIFYGIVNIKNLSLNGCTSLELIKDLTEVDMLNLQDCSSLASIDSINKANLIYLKGSGITEEYIEKYKPHLLSKCKW